MKYQLIREKKKKKLVISFLPIQGFEMNPKLSNHKSLITIKNMILVEKKIKEEMMNRQFDRLFRRLIKMTLDVTESEESTNSDCAIALNEVTKTMSILEKKYQKELKAKEYILLQKKLFILETKLKEKLIQIRNNEKLLQQLYYQNEKIEEKGKSR